MEDFITYELAVKLKEKGFREKCYAYYFPTNNELCYNINQFRGGILYDCLYSYNSFPKDVVTSDFIDAPTISQVLKWLREEKMLHIEPCILADADTDADSKVINEYIYWSFSVTSIETGDMIYFEYEHIDDKRFDSYERAALAGIKYVIDNLI